MYGGISSGHIIRHITPGKESVAGKGRSSSPMAPLIATLSSNAAHLTVYIGIGGYAHLTVCDA